MSQFHVGDRVRVRPGYDERLVIRDNPILSMIVAMSGGMAELDRSFEIMPVPEGTVVAVDVTYVHGDITLHDAVLVGLIDGRREPYGGPDLELIESLDDEIKRELTKETQ